jgi:hypothetical protein
MNFFSSIPIADALQVWDSVKEKSSSTSKPKLTGDGLDFSFITPTLLGQIYYLDPIFNIHTNYLSFSLT